MSFVPTITVLGSETHTYEGEGFTITFRLNSLWDAGYNAEIEITNTGQESIYEWVLSMNRPMGLAENWHNGGRLAHQDASETTIGSLDWNSYIPVGGSVSLWLYGTHEGVMPIPTDYRLSRAELQIVPEEDYTLTISNYSEWDNRFNHSISLVNNTDRVMKGWQVAFYITGGGAYLNEVSNAKVIQDDAFSATLIHIPRSNQSFHPGMNLHLGIMGTRTPGVNFAFENVVLYEKVALPYGGWDDWEPDLADLPDLPNQPETDNEKPPEDEKPESPYVELPLFIVQVPETEEEFTLPYIPGYGYLDWFLMDDYIILIGLTPEELEYVVEFIGGTLIGQLLLRPVLD